MHRYRSGPTQTTFDLGAEQFETPEALLRGVKNGSVRTLNPETMPRSVGERQARRRNRLGAARRNYRSRPRCPTM